ncbi:hypothetical protein [Oceaniglobus trochenteri]|uniref:hypothetical protein n=1 Tax=Oceaniglobus trochenteri TaxID=2763260 RepID=UPI001CFF897C|nr:hypothetical protein [Oceaniglobus trochenteri]
MTRAAPISLIDAEDLPEYPLGPDDRIDSHNFIAWFHRRWLSSEMRLKGTESARAIYFDLICLSQDQTPVGTLPDDMEQLAKLAMVEESRFRRMCEGPFGPLHRWTRCRCDGQVRLMHHSVTQMVLDAFGRKQDNRARNEAANAKKRIQRLRTTLAGYNAQLAKNDAAVLWMDGWLVENGCQYRDAKWHERAIGAWSNHMFDMGRKGRQTVES